MAEQDIVERVVFPKGKQAELLERVLGIISIEKAAKLCSLSERTIRDWRREKYTVNRHALELLCWATKTPLLSDIQTKPRYWYVKKGAKLGWKAVIKKYGRFPKNEEYRRKRWREWWKKEGRFQVNLVTAQKPIKKPKFSTKVAEFVGIMMGDGGITPNQVGITLHKQDDKEYSLFVKSLIERIFSVPVSVYYRKDEQALLLSISRKALVVFCNQKLGLKIGNKIKQNLDIPQWVKKDMRFKKACLRGLVDTDGCVFDEVHYIRGKRYSYKRLNFRSASPSLRNSVFSLFRELGMTPKMRNTTAVQLEDKEEIKRYFKIIGTSNPKHLRRFKI